MMPLWEKQVGEFIKNGHKNISPPVYEVEVVSLSIKKFSSPSASWAGAWGQKKVICQAISAMSQDKGLKIEFSLKSQKITIFYLKNFGRWP